MRRDLATERETDRDDAPDRQQLGTGREPGWPRHTGQTFVLGGAPNVLQHPQNILASRC